LGFWLPPGWWISRADGTTPASPVSCRKPKKADFMDEKKHDPSQAEKLDRLEYLRNIRRECLKRLGLPEDARPEMVLRLVEIKEAMDKAQGKGKDKKKRLLET
jgi:hypothetical protein